MNMSAKKILFLVFYLLVTIASVPVVCSAADASPKRLSLESGVDDVAQLPEWAKSSSTARPSDALAANLEQDFSNLLMKRLESFSMPLVTSLKPAVLELMASTSKQILNAIFESKTTIDPKILEILKEPAQKLIALTSDLLPQLSKLPATSVDDFFSQLDSLKDELIGHLKTLEFAPGTSSDKAVRKLLTLLGSLDKAMQLFQGDIVSELKKRLSFIKEPISHAANKLLSGLPPETVERLLEPLKKFQGDIEQSLRAELDSFKKVLLEKLPQSLIQAIKIRVELLLQKINEDPKVLAQSFRQSVSLIKERAEILTRSLSDIFKNKDTITQMRRSLKDIESNLKGEKGEAIKPIVTDLQEQLETVQQMVTPVVSSDIGTNATQVAQAVNIPVQERTPEQKGILSDVFARIKKFEAKIKNVSSGLVENLMGETVVEPKSGAKPSPIFSELSEGTIIAIRSGVKSPGRGRYLSVDKNGMLKPTGTNDKELSCQFTVVRLGNYLGLQSRVAGEKYLQCDPATGEVKFAGTSFYADTADWEHFIPVGNRIDHVYFKNRKTGGYLSVRKQDEAWSQDGSVMARDDKGNPAQATSWGCFAIEIVRHPDEPLAQNTAVLEQLPAGTLVAIKSLKDSASQHYLEVFLNPSKKDLAQYKYFVRATGSNRNSPACQFYVMRKDNWIGFKTHGWRSLCAEPGTHKVKFIDRSDTFASSIEHWEIHPDKDGSLNSLWLQNRASRGYLTIPDGEWTKNLAWTAFARVKNPLAETVKGANPFVMEPAGRGDNGRFAIEIVKPLPDDVYGGGSTYSFIPAHHGKNEVQFHENWKFPAGDLELILKDIRAENNVYINLSSTLSKSSTALRVLLGRENNSSSSIRLGEDILFDAKDKDGAVVTPSCAFWVRLKDGVLAVGKGTQFDANVIAEVNIDKEKAASLNYVGLGGSIEPVFIGLVQMNAVQPEKPVVVPAPQEEAVREPEPSVEQPDVVQEEAKPEPQILPIVPIVPEEPPAETPDETVAFVPPVVMPVESKVPAKKAAKKHAKKKLKKPAKKKKSKKKKKPAAPKERSGKTMGRTFIQGAEGAHKDADQAVRERRLRRKRKEEAKKKRAKKKAPKKDGKKNDKKRSKKKAKKGGKRAKKKKGNDS